ncbi:MAG TPA: MerR family transcriptional regulator [Azospirillum sp.]|nr:MerR family transcriptional regulator [Azospirillum sp.]
MKAEGPVKSATAFRTISEVSGELDVPQHVLRFWETKFPQVRPLKRGGGRRYYRPEDVELLRRIQSLLYKEGYTIKGVQRLLKETRGALPPPRPDDTGDEEPGIPGLVVDDSEAPGTSSAAEPSAGLPDAVRQTIGEVVGELRALRALLVGKRKG